MTKREFLDKLKKALVNDLSGSVIQQKTAMYFQQKYCQRLKVRM